MSFVGAEVDLIDLWVEDRLRSEALALSRIDAGLEDRIFNYAAPVGTKYPFIIFQAQAPPRDVRGVGPVRVMVSSLYIVKAVAQTLNYHDLRDVAVVIDRAMTAPSTQAVVGGLILTSIREGQFALPEVEDGKQFRHLGGEYRIQAQAA